MVRRWSDIVGSNVVLIGVWLVWCVALRPGVRDAAVAVLALTTVAVVRRVLAPRVVVSPEERGAIAEAHHRLRWINSFTHATGNALNVVSGFSELLLGATDDERLTDEQRSSVRAIRSGSEHLIRLISALQLEAKYSVGAVHLNRAWVSVNETFRSLISAREGTVPPFRVVASPEAILSEWLIDSALFDSALLAVVAWMSGTRAPEVRIRMHYDTQTDQHTLRIEGRPDVPDAWSAQSGGSGLAHPATDATAAELRIARATFELHEMAVRLESRSVSDVAILVTVGGESIRVR